MSRSHGRHQPGTPPVEVRPRNWDQAKRAAAEQLDRLEPGWHVLYGTGSRRFYAMPLWETPCAVLLDAVTTEELWAQMRQIEAGALFPPFGVWTGVA